MPIYKIRSPALPIQPKEYDSNQMDQFQNVLRLYFNRLDEFNTLNSIPEYGTTADRPTLELQIGQFYFDTTLNSAIYWNGTNWVTAGGPYIDVRNYGYVADGVTNNYTAITNAIAALSATGLFAVVPAAGIEFITL